MSKLAEKIRKSRETLVEVDKYKFTVRRPTDLDMLEFRNGITPRALIQYVIGWDGVTEGDLLRGGDPHPLAFDPEACAEWLADRPDLFGQLVNRILESYQAHTEALEAARKN